MSKFKDNIKVLRDELKMIESNVLKIQLVCKELHHSYVLNKDKDVEYTIRVLNNESVSFYESWSELISLILSIDNEKV